MVADDLSHIRSHFSRHLRIKEFSSYGGKIHTLSWNANGTKLASGSADKLVNLYGFEPYRLTRLQTYRGHSESVDQVCWHPTDNEVLASTGADGTTRIWDCRSKRDPISVQLKGENINLAWSTDARYVAVGNKADLVSWLDVRSGLKVIQSEQFNFEINEFSWRPNTDLFFLTTGLGSILVYSGVPGELRRVASQAAHPVNAMCLQFSPSGQHFAIGSADALISVWDADEFVCLRTLARLEWPVRTLGFSHDGQLLAAASEDHFIDIGHVNTGESVFQIGTQSAATFVLSWHPKHYLLAYSSEAKSERDQGTIRLFGLPSDSSRSTDP